MSLTFPTSFKSSVISSRWLSHSPICFFNSIPHLKGFSAQFLVFFFSNIFLIFSCECFISYRVLHQYVGCHSCYPCHGMSPCLAYAGHITLFPLAVQLSEEETTFDGKLAPLRLLYLSLSLCLDPSHLSQPLFSFSVSFSFVFPLSQLSFLPPLSLVSFFFLYIFYSLFSLYTVLFIFNYSSIFPFCLI